MPERDAQSAVVMQLGPAAAGLALSPTEFDAAEFEPGWRYELIQGILVVNPAPRAQERGPNEHLGYLLLRYRDAHPQGSHLDATLPEHDIHVGDQRRRADRVIWANLGRQPRADETPTIAVEFVSAGKQNLIRDYQQKRGEYEQIGVQEYWVINRFERTVTVFRAGEAPLVVSGDASYSTSLLPGFELPLAELMAAADRWNT